MSNELQPEILTAADISALRAMLQINIRKATIGQPDHFDGRDLRASKRLEFLKGLADKLLVMAHQPCPEEMNDTEARQGE